MDKIFTYYPISKETTPLPDISKKQFRFAICHNLDFDIYGKNGLVMCILPQHTESISLRIHYPRVLSGNRSILAGGFSIFHTDKNNVAAIFRFIHNR